MKGTMRSITFQSSLLKETFDLHVYMPENYSPLYTYHLAIAQDGRDYFQFGRIGRKMEAAIEDGAEETIVVGVPYPDVDTRRVWYHPDSDQQKNYVQFLVNELLPFLEEEFSVSHLSHGRLLMGDSLAATVSLMTALEYPNIFSRVMMHSPFVNETVLNAVRQSKVWNSFDIYHTIGLEETKVKTTTGKVEDFLTPNRRLHQLFQQGNARYRYVEFEGGHFWKYWEKDLLISLSFMFDTE
ncbi:alpha/beta hydrolase [Alteribacillus sp. HJP-4]|uniref:alpha/beta hydrolase n=1 Tax=Alteribacillus sp. HJP-4 TaxID=2775394 RepID=UPI0035CCFCF5